MRGSWGMTESGMWRLVRGAPSPRLGEGVSDYRGFHLALDRPQRRIEFPSGMITMVINFGDRIRIGPVATEETSGSGPRPEPYRSLVNGPRSDATMGEHDGRLEGVEVHLAPWMAYTVLRVDMHELRGRMVPLADLLGPEGDEWEGRLAQAVSWADRFALLDTMLLRRCARGRAAAPQVVWTWNRLVRSEGAVPVGPLATAAGWSARHLELRFREQIGMSPKTVARVLRMQRALRMLTAGTAPARTAAACGFYDQAHLHRDFKVMTGVTPGTFLLHRGGAGRPVDRMPGKVTSTLLR
ncbi:helix-turn-helix domain-containing protein [Streptomyces sp. NBC_00669]|uniref:AraC family transcriptional regulator n=1 Tax=unclassified Streptomyces TaxID=2593676 RepID=UPI002E3435BD|nr:helix-turn-helix domain-containing protein [Streptomyces sp. NBC_00669]